jgi:hypothetical protein
MAKSRGIGCGSVVLILIVAGLVSNAINPRDADTSAENNTTPRATSTATPRATSNATASNSAACTKAFNANVAFVDVMNRIDSADLSNEAAAEEMGLIEKELDSTRKTISNSSFQSGMLLHANIVNLAKMSLLNNDRETYDYAVKEFISNAGYFTPHCG